MNKFVVASLSLAAFLVAGCNGVSVVHSESTSKVVLSETAPSVDMCALKSTFAIDLSNHTVAYSTCLGSKSTLATGTIAFSDSEFAAVYAKLVDMKTTAGGNEAFSESGVVTADITDGGATTHYVDADTASGSDDEQLSGCLAAIDEVAQIVQSHLAA